ANLNSRWAIRLLNRVAKLMLKYEHGRDDNSPLAPGNDQREHPWRPIESRESCTDGSEHRLRGRDCGIARGIDGSGAEPGTELRYRHEQPDKENRRGHYSGSGIFTGIR